MSNPFATPSTQQAYVPNLGVIPAVFSVLLGLYFLRHYFLLYYYGGYEFMSPGELSPPYRYIFRDLMFIAWEHSALLMSIISLIAAERWIRKHWIQAALLNVLSFVVSSMLFYAISAI